MEYTSKTDGTTCELGFSGQFSFSDNATVRKIIEEVTPGNFSRCSIDMNQLQSIDSAGLGMILLINDALQEAGKSLELKGATGQVQKMLEISKFSEIISINP